ncbi:MAG: aldehyde ferredoxin oxidoreductase family protein [Syntrophorhabdales bacterium]|jgi:aldehyde:ferredoxin oxidoreductase
MARGYMGRMLWVDLSRKELKEEALDEKLCREYVGGYGLGAKILFDRQPAGIDPLGPDAILGFLTGCASGTAAVGASRYVVVGKSPLTGGWGDANSGGDFGPSLKHAGYDAVFFTGISDKPVYLSIDSGKAELKDASDLWGKDTFETEDIFKERLGKDAEVACIGQAGEKMALIAAVMNNKGRAAARSGLGAVMGSKRLKAIVVKGNVPVPQADEEKVKELRKKYLGELGGHADMMRNIGTPAIFTILAEAGDTPTKNWSGTSTIDFPQFRDIGAGPVIERQSKKYACYRCPIGCGGHMKEGTGEYKYPAGSHKPEYETLGMFGASCLNNNVDSIIMANDICNRYGVDTISAGACIAFAIECYESGIITKDDTDGIEMTWGNHRSIVAMTEKMVRKEGFGSILADGVKVAAEKIGKGADQYAMHIGGQEAAAHDPKFGMQWGISYALDATPARHTQGGEGPHCPGVMPEYDQKAAKGRGVPHKIGSNYTHVYNAAGLCMFVVGAYPDASALLHFLNAITGWNMDMAELQKTGERIANIRMAFNVREGLNPVEYKVPGRISGNPPPEKGPLAGVTVDRETLYREFLTAMDWDLKTAKPSKNKLLELGMEGVAKVLWP